MENIRIRRTNDTNYSFTGKWYIAASGALDYLHTDGVWRRGCLDINNKEHTGYFNSKEEAEQTLAKWQASQKKEETTMSKKFIVRSTVKDEHVYKYFAYHPGGGYQWHESKHKAAEFDTIGEAADNLSFVSSNIILVEITLKPQTSFPVLIKLTDTDEESVIDKPEDLPQGVAFTIIETNVQEQEKE